MLTPGDRVAVLSPSYAAPAEFPAVHERSLERLRDEFGLAPVEFPTTRRHSTPRERAADLMAAYADPAIRAVFATIGGDDQITVLPHLDPAPFVADPKPFFGYSDNTNLLNWLWCHGVAGYHGMSTMVHLSRASGVGPEVAASLRAALFTGGDLEIRPAAEFREDELNWGDPIALTGSVPSLTSPGRVWHGAGRVVSGRTWGGCLESLHPTLAVGRWVRPVADYAGSILLLETSEEMPSATAVFRMLRDFGERGLLEQFPAVLVGTAKATALFQPRPVEERQAYRDEQREAVLKAFAAYHPEAMIVFGVDFGHTDPQWVLPYGGRMTVDGIARTITAHY
ncbi:S66 family peptidase [Pseudosporangium ferrugineum]|uniref:Muramoyltetrapeptide carboxypeptidase LdcA involved in peptidoglycan recycling n=1 Tax=Pseudosporangium ferrugineum TaxID=439699 RepID=A0A2T0S8B8_9ACTN|nr:S66 peptidase family protein [Pseudosporangium ferrugineum]PRY29553.1 muramoyltetrapeptide carboxypeptidase LdcA involved in peptidoglycan recycling [Pseudosporangium ferrugineum]